MRKYLFITMCAFLSLWAGKVSAQRYLPGQTGLELRLGGVGDFGTSHIGNGIVPGSTGGVLSYSSWKVYCIFASAYSEGEIYFIS